MIYRDLGKTGFKASLLGMGCMRLPYIDDADLKKGVNREEAFELIRYAVDNGINYFDTAQGYHGGNSEDILGEALDYNAMREKVWITTKYPTWGPLDPANVRSNLEKTLRKLRTDFLDTLLIHGIGPGNWDKVKSNDVLGQFEKFKSEGLIRHIGFSYHGNYEHFKEVVAFYPWEVSLLMHNLIDDDKEVTADGVALTAELGVAVTIMEPLRGGGLSVSPAPVAAVYDSFPTPRAPTEWAFRYLADMPGVHCIVSGMSNMKQLKENIAIFSKPDMVPGCLTDEERKTLDFARKAYKSIITIPCTRCNYCMPCPQNVDISNIFNLFNDGHRFEFFNQVRRSYMFARRGGSGAERCTECGECVPKCPIGIDIPAQLALAHEALKDWEE